MSSQRTGRTRNIGGEKPQADTAATTGDGNNPPDQLLWMQNMATAMASAPPAVQQAMAMAMVNAGMNGVQPPTNTAASPPPIL